MEARACDPDLIKATSLKAYFHQELGRLLDRREPGLSQEVRAYLVNLLQQFSRSERFFEWYGERMTLRPLALLYGEAVEAPSLQEKRLLLRRLGDVALFVAGVFAPSLEHKVVGVGYYIDMGCRAYDTLSDSLENTRSRSLGGRTFRELAENFAEMVSVLDEFAEHSGLHGATPADRFALAWKEFRCRPAAGSTMVWH